VASVKSLFETAILLFTLTVIGPDDAAVDNAGTITVNWVLVAEVTTAATLLNSTISPEGTELKLPPVMITVPPTVSEAGEKSVMNGAVLIV
jgi:hypothetical protein